MAEVSVSHSNRDPRRNSFHAYVLRILLGLCVVGALLCQGQAFSTDPADCKYTYEFEGSRLDFCSVKVRQDLLHPDAKNYHVEVYGYLVNRSSHLWARVYFEITLAGTDANTGKAVKHSWTVTRDRIHREVPATFAEWFPSGVVRPRFFQDPVVSVRVVDDYTFPKLEQLQAAEEEAESSRRRAEAKAAAEAKRLNDQYDARQRQKRAELARACRAIYQATISKRVVELTVREADQISACKTLGMYQ